MYPPFREGTPRPEAESGQAPQPPVTYAQETMPPPNREYIQSMESYRDALSAMLDSSVRETSPPEKETSIREGSPSSIKMECDSEGASPSSSRAASRGRTPPRTGSRSREGTPSNPENLARLIDWLNLKFIPVDPNKFLQSRAFALCDMRTTLLCAAHNIHYQQDTYLCQTVKEARGPEHCVEVNLERMYATRGVQW